MTCPSFNQTYSNVTNTTNLKLIVNGYIQIITQQGSQ